MNSIDSPVCKHQWALLNPNPCPECTKDATASVQPGSDSTHVRETNMGRVSEEVKAGLPTSQEILRTFDAVEWAKNFMRHVEVIPGYVDEETMIGWFANSIMRGFDEASHRRDNEISDALAAKNIAYWERNKLVAALAQLYPSGTAKTTIPDWDPEWHGCVYIDLPTGQVSWHYHDSEAHLFADLPAYTKPWDGHTTPEKYERLARLHTGKSDGSQ